MNDTYWAAGQPRGQTGDVEDEKNWLSSAFPAVVGILDQTYISDLR